MTTVLRYREFNQVFTTAIDEVITELLGHNVLESLYTALATYHDIQRDELPYRLDTAYSVLEQTFGVDGARTIGMRIVHRLYDKLNLPLIRESGYTAIDYVNVVKKKLGDWGP